MSVWCKIYYKTLHLFVKIFVKTRLIPKNSVIESGLDASSPVVYILPCRSRTDLIILQAESLKQGLPDPFKPLEINGILLPGYLFIDHQSQMTSDSQTLFSRYLELHSKNPALDISILPVSIMIGRRPAPDKSKMGRIQKLFTILWLGRDSFVHLSSPVSSRQIVNAHGTDPAIAPKLARVARIHFFRQYLSSIGPVLPVRSDLFKKLLSSKAIEKALLDEVHSKKISYKKAQDNALALMKEIASNVSYETVRLSDRVLGWMWNRLYQGIHVHNADRVRELAKNGHSIVYIPCHRSHMDYLLLSYVLYYEALVPPHIAAGINLNFWPAGAIFRRLGAFFIRRTFKGNKLYSTIFREYLSELFTGGYPVEYFIEGGRSRTGLLLEPKTGTLSITIQAMLRDISRPITLVPVYIGYEHVIEVLSYTKELKGERKKKENFFQMIRGLLKLRHLGQGYVNFGEPIPLRFYLDQNVPHWRTSVKTAGKFTPEDLSVTLAPRSYELTESAARPHWLTSTVKDLAHQIMIKINNVAVINAINLCATALLASEKKSLTRSELLEQLDCYLQIMRHVPYSRYSSVPDQAPEALLDHALNMSKCIVQKNHTDERICLPEEQVPLMRYYRNNIQHLFLLPSLIATMVLSHENINRQEIIRQINILYPVFKIRWFLYYDETQLSEALNLLMDEFIRQQCVENKKHHFTLNPSRRGTLKILASGIKEILQHYSIIFFLLKKNPDIGRKSLEKDSKTMARQLCISGNTPAAEFSDSVIFSNLLTLFKKRGNMEDDPAQKSIEEIFSILKGLVCSKMISMMESSLEKASSTSSEKN